MAPVSPLAAIAVLLLLDRSSSSVLSNTVEEFQIEDTNNHHSSQAQLSSSAHRQMRTSEMTSLGTSGGSQEATSPTEHGDVTTSFTDVTAASGRDVTSTTLPSVATTFTTPDVTARSPSTYVTALTSSTASPFTFPTSDLTLDTDQWVVLGVAIALMLGVCVGIVFLVMGRPKKSAAGEKEISASGADVTSSAKSEPVPARSIPRSQRDMRRVSSDTHLKRQQSSHSFLSYVSIDMPGNASDRPAYGNPSFIG